MRKKKKLLSVTLEKKKIYFIKSKKKMSKDNPKSEQKVTTYILKDIVV